MVRFKERSRSKSRSKTNSGSKEKTKKTKSEAGFGFKRAVVTSALPYIHGTPHLGNLAGSILPADIFHRYLNIRGVDNIFICGSDVHGTPMEVAAIKKGIPVRKLVDEQHRKVKELFKKFEFDFSIYGRTDSKFNEKQTREMFMRLYDNGYIFEKEQKQPYCRNCKRFLPDRYIEGECPQCGGLGRGDQCDDCGNLLNPEELKRPYCTICGSRKIDFRSTKNLFLRLSKPEVAHVIKEWLKEDPVPKRVKNQVLKFIKQGLEDRCITRDIRWGFSIPPVKGLDKSYRKKVLYVWFDAPIGYISFTQEYFASKGKPREWEKYWKSPQAKTFYSIGKDNTIFHAIIWPAVLHGCRDNYTLPYKEFVQEFLLTKDIQFSKSRSTGLTLDEALKLVPGAYWRFYLAYVLPQKQDSVFTPEDFEDKINSLLNDTLGNFVNRVLTLTEKWFGGAVPEGGDSRGSKKTLRAMEELIGKYEKHFESYEFKEALETSLDIARLGDRYLGHEEPWNKENMHKRPEVIYTCVNLIKALAITIYPFIPSASERVWKFLNQRGKPTWDLERITPGHKLNKSNILFEKINVKNKLKKMEEVKKMSAVSFEEFQKLDIRTGKIMEVKDHPKADKLYIMKIDVGGKLKQTVAGLKPFYKKQELKGKNVVVINNLEPAKLRGEKSECMLLAADSGKVVSILQPDKEVGTGKKVR